MAETKILLAEDDVNLGTLLREYLNVKGFKTVLCENGNTALKAFKEDTYTLCIFDIMMPYKDGLTLAKEVRLISPDIPIIFLTAKSDGEDILEGFKLGADDYVTKPFSIEELVYRIKAIQKRTEMRAKNEESDIYHIGNYTFHVHKQTLTFEPDQSVTNLTTKEVELLAMLCQHSNLILERNFALKNIWLSDSPFNARSMDVYITRLRKYFKDDPSVKILNVHGKGYKLIS